MPKTFVFDKTKFTPAEYAMFMQLRAIRRAVSALAFVFIVWPLFWLVVWLVVR